MTSSRFTWIITNLRTLLQYDDVTATAGEQQKSGDTDEARPPVAVPDMSTMDSYLVASLRFMHDLVVASKKRGVTAEATEGQQRRHDFSYILFNKVGLKFGFVMFYGAAKVQKEKGVGF